MYFLRSLSCFPGSGGGRGLYNTPSHPTCVSMDRKNTLNTVKLDYNKFPLITNNFLDFYSLLTSGPNTEFWRKYFFFDGIQFEQKIVQHYIFLSLFVVLGHVQVGNFFLVFSLHTHHFQGDTIKSRQRFDHVVEERKEIQMNQSFPLNSLLSFSK